MYDKTLVTDGLLDIEEALVHIIDRTSWIKTADDFATTPRGVDIDNKHRMALAVCEIEKIMARILGRMK